MSGRGVSLPDRPLKELQENELRGPAHARSPQKKQAEQKTAETDKDCDTSVDTVKEMGRTAGSCGTSAPPGCELVDPDYAASHIAFHENDGMPGLASREEDDDGTDAADPAMQTLPATPKAVVPHAFSEGPVLSTKTAVTPARVLTPARDKEGRLTQGVENEDDSMTAKEAGLHGQLASKLAPLVARGIQMAADIAKEDTVMLVGLTGAGKSTLINYCNDINQEVVTENSKIRVRVVGDQPAAAKLGNGRVSTTKFFKVATRAVQESDSRRDKDEPLYFADTQGLEDTAGQMYDIVNCVTLREVTKHCSSLRIALTLSWHSMDDNFLNFRKFCDQCIGLLGKPADIVTDSIIFVVTQVPEEGHESEAAVVGAVKSEIEEFCKERIVEEKDENMVSTVSDFVKVLIDLIDDDQVFVFSNQMNVFNSQGRLRNGPVDFRKAIRKIKSEDAPQTMINVTFPESSLNYMKTYIREVQDHANDLIESAEIRASQVTERVQDLLELKRLLQPCTANTDFIDAVVDDIRCRFQGAVHSRFQVVKSQVELQTSGGRCIEHEAAQLLSEIADIVTSAASPVSVTTLGSAQGELGNELFTLVKRACENETTHIVKALKNAAREGAADSITQSLQNIAILVRESKCYIDTPSLTPYDRAVEYINDKETAIDKRLAELASGECGKADVELIIELLNCRRALRGVVSSSDKLKWERLETMYVRCCDVVAKMLTRCCDVALTWLAKYEPHVLEFAATCDVATETADVNAASADDTANSDDTTINPVADLQEPTDEEQKASMMHFTVDHDEVDRVLRSVQFLHEFSSKPGAATHFDPTTFPNELLERVVSGCGSVFAKLDVDAEHLSESAARLLKAVAAISCSTDLEDCACKKLDVLRRNAQVAAQMVTDFLNGSWINNNNSVVEQLANWIDRLRESQWLDDLCDAGVTKAVASAEKSAAAKLDDIAGKLDAGNSMCSWNKHVEVLTRLRVLGGRAEELYQEAFTKRKQAVPDLVDKAVCALELGCPQEDGKIEIDASTLTALEDALGGLNELQTSESIRIDDPAFFATLQPLEDKLAAGLESVREQVLSLLDSPIEDMAGAAEQLMFTFQAICAVFDVERVSAMNGPISTAKNQLSKYPRVMGHLDESNLHGDAAEALQKHCGEIEELLESCTSIDDVCDLKSALSKFSKPLDKFLESSSFQSMFDALRVHCVRVHGALRRKQAKLGAQDLENGLSCLTELACGEACKANAKMMKMAKVFNQVNFVTDADQVFRLAEAITTLSSFITRVWDGREPITDMKSIHVIQSSLQALNVLNESKGLNAKVKQHLNEQHEVDIEHEVRAVLSHLNEIILAWIETVDCDIRDQDYEQVTNHLGLLKKIVRGTGYGAAGTKDCVFQTLVKTLIIKGTVDTATAEGSSGAPSTPAPGRVVTGTWGIFGQMVNRQLHRLHDILEAPIINHEAAQVLLKRTATLPNAFKGMNSAAMSKSGGDKKFWKSESKKLREAVEVALQNCCEALKPLVETLAVFQKHRVSAVAYHEAGSFLVKVLREYAGENPDDPLKKGKCYTSWEQMNSRYTPCEKVRNDDLKGTLEWMKEHDYEAYLRQVQEEKDKVTNASHTAEELLALPTVSAEDLNATRHQISDMPEDVVIQIREQCSKAPDEFLRSMDEKVREDFERAGNRFGGELKKDRKAAAKTAQKLLALSGYTGLQKENDIVRTVEVLQEVVVTTSEHVGSLLGPVEEACASGSSAALEKVSTVVAAVQQLMDSQEVISSASNVTQALNADDLSAAEIRAKRIRANEAGVKIATAKKKQKEHEATIVELQATKKALQAETERAEKETEQLEDEVESCREQVKRAVTDVEEFRKSLILKTGKITTNVNRLAKLEAKKAELKSDKDILQEAENKLAANKKSAAAGNSSRKLDELTRRLDKAKRELNVVVAAVNEAEKVAARQGDAPRQIRAAAAVIDKGTVASVQACVEKYVETIFNEVPSCSQSSKERDVQHIERIFAAETTDTLRKLAGFVDSSKAERVLADSHVWATNQLDELSCRFKEALQAADFDRVQICLALMQALKDVKQPPLVTQCKRDLIAFTKERRNSAQAKLSSFKVGDENPRDTSEAVAEELATMTQAALSVPFLKDDVDKATDAVLRKVLEVQKRPGAHKRPTLAELFDCLESGENQFGKHVSQHEMFKGSQIALWNVKTGEFGSAYAVSNCSGSDKMSDDIDRDELRTVIDETLRLHQAFVDKTLIRPKPGTSVPDGLRELARGARDLAPQHDQRQKGIARWSAAMFHAVFFGASANSRKSREKWVRRVHQVLPEMLARVLAVWTIQKSADAWELCGKDRSALLAPKASQLLGIFRLHGLGSKTKDGCMDSHLAQIRTGEGKSVTLGVLATVNALLGYDVDVVCYSQDLSRRDFDGFKDVFEVFGVSGNIAYCTLEELADRHGDPSGHRREFAAAACRPSASPALAAEVGLESRRPRLLAIDEFDQILNPKVFGQDYRFGTKITGDKVAQLLRHIYSNNLGPEDWRDFRNAPVYKQLEAEIKPPLLVAAVRNMLQCRSTLDEHKRDSPSGYVVQDGRIGYVLHDGVNFNMRHGYHTAFAYLCEEETGEVSPATAAAQLFIPLECGQFSYSEILSQYLRVYGVSGTLPTRDDDMHIVEEEFGITKRTEVPSIFGKSCLKFRQEADTCIEEDESNWHLQIQKLTMAAVQGSKGEYRAVIQVFSCTAALFEFLESSSGRDLEATNGVQVQMITEKTSPSERARRIVKASSQGTITLITRALGRGTDFRCKDQKVLDNGGVHVLQTFWSLDEAEMIQIQGRTARQGQEGSYSLVLCSAHLQKLGFEPDNITTWKGAGRVFNGLRVASNQLCCEMNASRLGAAAACRQRQDETDAAYRGTTIRPDGMNDFVRFLLSRNPAPARLGAVKIVIALDGTGSMSGVIGKTKATMGEMLQRTDTVLTKAGVTDADYQVQIAVYRNYNANLATELLQLSSWEMSPAPLVAFLETVEASYGWSDEAVEVALAHAVQEQVAMVIVIGDADAHDTSEVVRKREASKTNQWASDDRFKVATDFRTEAQILKSMDCPVSTFFVPKGKKKCVSPPDGFKLISDITGGEAGILDVNVPGGGADALTDTVCMQILSCLDKGDANELQTTYKAMFCN